MADDPPKIVCCFFVAAKCSEKMSGCPPSGIAIGCFIVLGLGLNLIKIKKARLRKPGQRKERGEKELLSIVETDRKYLIVYQVYLY